MTEIKGLGSSEYHGTAMAWVLPDTEDEGAWYLALLTVKDGSVAVDAVPVPREQVGGYEIYLDDDVQARVTMTSVDVEYIGGVTELRVIPGDRESMLPFMNRVMFEQMVAQLRRRLQRGPAAAPVGGSAQAGRPRRRRSHRR